MMGNPPAEWQAKTTLTLERQTFYTAGPMYITYVNSTECAGCASTWSVLAIRMRKGYTWNLLISSHYKDHSSAIRLAKAIHDASGMVIEYAGAEGWVHVLPHYLPTKNISLFTLSTSKLWSLTWLQTWLLYIYISLQSTCHRDSLKSRMLGATLQWNLVLREHPPWWTTYSWQMARHVKWIWTCHQRPPVLRDHILMTNVSVFQDGLHCT